MGLSTYSKLYESCALPVLNYSSIVWAHADYSKSDQVQYKALLVFMGLHRHASLLGIVEDKGRIPNVLHRNIEYIRYWNRIIKMDDNRIPKYVFNQEYKCRNQKHGVFVLKIFESVGMKHVCDSQTT